MSMRRADLAGAKPIVHSIISSSMVLGRVCHCGRSLNLQGAIKHQLVLSYGSLSALDPSYQTSRRQKRRDLTTSALFGSLQGSAIIPGRLTKAPTKRVYSSSEGSILNSSTGKPDDDLLQAETTEFLETADPSTLSSQKAAQLLEQWLARRKEGMQTSRFARRILLRWLTDVMQPGDSKTITEYFHRVLHATAAPDAYEIFQAFQATGLPIIPRTISMVSERMSPEQWDDSTILSALEQFDSTSKDTVIAKSIFLLHVPWTGDAARAYLEANIAQPTEYAYAAVIKKYLKENNLPEACAMAEIATSKLEDATVCTNLCMFALAKQDRAKDVERLFRTLKSPNDHSYSALLQTLPPEQGRVFFLEQSERDCSAHAYSIIMSKYAKQGNMGQVVEELLEHASGRLPTDELDVLKGITITAWKNTSTWEAPDRATAVYMSVENPSVALTTALLQVWAKSARPDADERCCTMFQSMVNDGTASLTCYNLMLSAQPADDAWAMLQAQAKLMGQPGVITPTAASWATVMARPGHSIERIYEIINHYKDSLKKKQRDDPKVYIQAILSFPSAPLAHAFAVAECRSDPKRDYSEVYLVLMKRWSRSRDAMAPERAEEIAQWIQERQQGPDMIAAVQELLIHTWSASRREAAADRIGILEGRNRPEQALASHS